MPTRRVRSPVRPRAPVPRGRSGQPRGGRHVRDIRPPTGTETMQRTAASLAWSSPHCDLSKGEAIYRCSARFGREHRPTSRPSTHAIVSVHADSPARPGPWRAHPRGGLFPETDRARQDGFRAGLGRFGLRERQRSGARPAGGAGNPEDGRDALGRCSEPAAASADGLQRIHPVLLWISPHRGGDQSVGRPRRDGVEGARREDVPASARLLPARSASGASGVDPGGIDGRSRGSAEAGHGGGRASSLPSARC